MGKLLSGANLTIARGLTNNKISAYSGSRVTVLQHGMFFPMQAATKMYVHTFIGGS
jgi:hypothetical protein